MEPPLSPRQRAALDTVTRFLLECGVSEEEIAEALAAGRLDLLVIERMIVPGKERLGLSDLVHRTGVSEEIARREWRALGLPQVGESEAVFTELDVEALRVVEAAMALGIADLERTLQLGRVIGSSMARIAETQVTLAQLVEDEGDHILRAEALAVAARELIPAMLKVLEFAYRRHLQAAARRAWLYSATDRTGDEGDIELAVGFADMVGFTMISQQVSGDELARIVTRFEELATDTIVGGGGRVVKTIGDEVMFVVDEAGAAARIALNLSDAYADDELLSDVRIGLSWGRALPWEGDYFGPTVNAASRIVALAEPGSVLATKEFVEEAGNLEGIELSRLRPVWIKDLGRVEIYRLDRAGKARPSRKRRYGLGWRLIEEVLYNLEEIREQGHRLLLAVTQPERDDPKRRED
jgi:adenylate cyclase